MGKKKVIRGSSTEQGARAGTNYNFALRDANVLYYLLCNG